MEYLDILLISKNQDPINKLVQIEELKKEVINFNSRELYILDSKYSFDISSLIIKKNCILVKIDFIRAIIFKEKVYLINLKNSEFERIKIKIIDCIKKNLNNKKFHILFLESLFSEIATYFDYVIHVITPKIITNNELIRSGHYTYNNFRELQTELLSLEYRVKELKNLTDELVDNKEDIEGMKLNDQNNKIDEIEEMIENYSLKFQDLDYDISRLTREMDNVQKLVNIDLAKKRNIYAVFNIYISVFSLALSLGSYVGSMFGMNLKNGLDKSNIAFIIVCSISLFLVLVSVYIQIYCFKKLVNI